MNVFWSWQNDYESKVCRHFIREALVEATKAATEGLDFEEAERPEVDHDTKGMPGMVDIAQVILDKIATSSVFVADVTPISETKDGKKVPNPNVMVELGWAMKSLGIERVIAVYNTSSGARPDDLPFDIRHRRVMSYTLPPGANSTTRAKVKKDLVRELTVAVRANLLRHLDTKAATLYVQGVPANPSNRSIWASATEHLKYVDPMEPGKPKRANLSDVPRGYLRVIPLAWNGDVPQVSEIAALRDDLCLWPMLSSSLDYGTCEEGYIRFGLRGDNESDEVEIRDAVMYFDATGEFWSLAGHAVADADRGVYLRDEALITYWATGMKTIYGVFAKFGASPIWKVEVGLVGVHGVRVFGKWEYDSPASRKREMSLSRQFRGWDESAQLGFLADALTRINDLFGRPRVTERDIQGLLPPRWKADES